MIWRNNHKEEYMSFFLFDFFCNINYVVIVSHSRINISAANVCKYIISSSNTVLTVINDVLVVLFDYLESNYLFSQISKQQKTNKQTK